MVIMGCYSLRGRTQQLLHNVHKFRPPTHTHTCFFGGIEAIPSDFSWFQVCCLSNHVRCSFFFCFFLKGIASGCPGLCVDRRRTETRSRRCEVQDEDFNRESKQRLGHSPAGSGPNQLLEPRPGRCASPDQPAQPPPAEPTDPISCVSNYHTPVWLAWVCVCVCV